MPIHAQLLEQAQLLATFEPRRPVQASVRRSISASYYAVFHFLVGEAAGLQAGRGRSNAAHRELLMRCFKHGEMAEVSKAFQRGWSRLPSTVQRLAPGVVTHPDVLHMADAFLDLQRQRHIADYDLSTRVLRRTAIACAKQASSAIARWPGGLHEPSARAFLACLSCWQRVAAR